MPKISVNPSASRAYCAPMLTPMIAAWMNWSTGSVRRGFLSGYAQVLSVLDDADAEREMQFLRDAELLLAGPVALADIRVLHRQRPQCRGNRLGIVGAGDGNRLQRHPRRRQIGPDGGATDRILAEQLPVQRIDLLHLRIVGRYALEPVEILHHIDAAGHTENFIGSRTAKPTDGAGEAGEAKLLDDDAGIAGRRGGRVHDIRLGRQDARYNRREVGCAALVIFLGC